MVDRSDLEKDEVTTTNTVEDLELEVRTYADRFQQLVNNVERVIHGKTREIRIAFLCMLAQGHLLIEDVPGTGKTSLARALAESVDGTLTRIQFTPDLLPSDVTGVQIFNQSNSEFEFHPGAVFANVVLADEINRASPKTQSSLLEVMEEYQVTVDGVPRPVPNPFLVIATQNPIEHDGTYRLPEAQLDRFLIRTGLGYLDVATQVEVLASATHQPKAVKACIDSETVRRMIHEVELVHAERSVLDYIARIADATRNHPNVQLGVSTRGTVALLRSSRVRAAMQGQTFITPDHVRDLGEPVLAHRLILTPEAELRRVETSDVLAEIFDSVPPPVARLS